MQQEFSDMLRRHREACTAGIARLESIVSSFDPADISHPRQADAGCCRHSSQELATDKTRGPLAECSGHARRVVALGETSEGTTALATGALQGNFNHQTVPDTDHNRQNTGEPVDL